MTSFIADPYLFAAKRFAMATRESQIGIQCRVPFARLQTGHDCINKSSQSCSGTRLYCAFRTQQITSVF
jgi:hypothetical protein